ncbi:hypothetical protein DM01DRAFT_1037309 [Hesseltinella vesiculosa]|uniref:Uncharacterized protein n=1 Tax=Hesseltinella vesiculosa TaxID=101127 RepID=A0A1X2GIK2_9FUNG|nr:hypothetical protein DM01DRAFT_1037309 [Hesseltinella vesiculosa]
MLCDEAGREKRNQGRRTSCCLPGKCQGACGLKTNQALASNKMKWMLVKIALHFIRFQFGPPFYYALLTFLANSLVFFIILANEKLISLLENHQSVLLFPLFILLASTPYLHPLGRNDSP